MKRLLPLVVALSLVGVACVAESDQSSDGTDNVDTESVGAESAGTDSDGEPVGTTSTETDSGDTDARVSESGATPNSTAAVATESTEPESSTSVPIPQGVLFMETFDGNTGGDRFDYHVYHRNIDLYDFTEFSGGSWSGDHDLECNGPDTQRPLSFDIDDDQATRIASSVYLCKDHLMTSMGDVESYTIITFSPKETFDSVTEVCVDVNLTNLGIAQWFKIGIVTEEKYNSTSPTAGHRVPGFLVADVGASDLPHDLDDGDLLLASWSGGLSGGYPGGLKIGNVQSQIFSDPTPEDKATRHPVCFTDNQDGTLTFDVAGVEFTSAGVFPEGPVRVVFYDNSYEPNQTCDIDGRCVDGEAVGMTWHWDNVTIR